MDKNLEQTVMTHVEKSEHKKLKNAELLNTQIVSRTELEKRSLNGYEFSSDYKTPLMMHQFIFQTPQKLSIGALSKQLPLRLIEQIKPEFLRLRGNGIIMLMNKNRIAIDEKLHH